MKPKTTLSRRSLLALGAGAAFVAPSIARAQEANWPNRPIRIIAAFPAGSGTDNLARFYGQRRRRSFGQNVLIENTDAANDAIGASPAGRPAPDGHLLFLVSVSTHPPQTNF